MPVQVNIQPLNEAVDSKKRGIAGDNHQTPPKRKSAKNERASMLCSTPPTCIKDKDCHVEYTRKEFLGEVVLCKYDGLIVGRIRQVLFGYEPTGSCVCCESRCKGISQDSKGKGEGDYPLRIVLTRS